MRALLAVLVFLHGAVHGIMFGLPLIPEVKKDMAPFNPSHSSLLGERPSLAFAATARSDLGTRRTYSAARSTVSDGERPVRHCSGDDSGGG
jgi:hypothetical protein